MHALQAHEEKRGAEKDRKTPMMLAAVDGKTDEVERLIDEGEDIMAVDKVCTFDLLVRPIFGTSLWSHTLLAIFCILGCT